MSRASLPGSRASSALALVIALLGAGAGVAACGSAGAAHDAATLHGDTSTSYPSFLPKKTLQPDVDAAIVGTRAKPALQVEGLPVEAHTKAFHVLITVSGPVVPGEGLPKQQPATTCTWTVTMKDASADVPVSVSDFHAVDHLGSVAVLHLVPGEHAPPPVLHVGQTLHFQVQAYELVGDGTMQWAPDRTHVLANWDYSVEND